jgi:xanthine dehydrogenase YagS FAD-binding subunit
MMRPFSYVRAIDVKGALDLVAEEPDAVFIAGGTNLIDLMKLGVEMPARVVDISRLPLAEIEERPDSIRIGALTRNSYVAQHALIRGRYPVLSEALLAGASPQIRNMATVGGNVMQRTRCYYFNDTTMPCNKRVPGSGCSAVAGENRTHAILGTSEQCIAVHASDMCVALMALDARVQTVGLGGERSIPMAEFYVTPGATPGREAVLERGELIVAIDVPKTGFSSQSHYLKIRDRASYAFALASVAAVLEIVDGRICTARVALGGVATKPWRAYETEALLEGAAPTREVFTVAAQAAVEGAVASTQNAFKITLLQRAIVRALSTIGGNA